MATNRDDSYQQPDARGHFGPYGGMFVPETLMAPIAELARAYDKLSGTRRFRKRLQSLLRDYAGRPTPLYSAARLAFFFGVAAVEDYAHWSKSRGLNSDDAFV